MSTRKNIFATVTKRCLYRWLAEALHQKASPWWPEVARVDKTPQPDLGAARRAEFAAIEAEAPLHNRQHNVKRFRREGYEYVPVADAA